MNNERPVLRLTGLLLLASLVACTPAHKRADPSRPAGVQPAAPGEIPDELSLKSDRSAFNDARKDIPTEVKRENDELAFIRSLMAQGDEEPSRVRDRFTKAMRDRRTRADRDWTKRREDYSRKEKKDRDAFLKTLKDERGANSRGKKANPAKTREFFAEQDEKRNEYFAGERDRRRDFESQAMDERRTFEDYTRERTNDFNQEMRDYSTQFYERKKALALKKKVGGKNAAPANASRSETRETGDSTPSSSNGTGDPLLEEFKHIPKTPATPLGPTDQ